jgi:transposase
MPLILMEILCRGADTHRSHLLSSFRNLSHSRRDALTITATPRQDQQRTEQPTLFLAFELGVNTWNLAITTGAVQRPRERSVPAGDVQAVQEELGRAKRRFGLPEDARVVSCYEAGRDGFWRHRFFVAQRVENVVVESSSIEVKRRNRWAKTERLDVHKLRTMLLRSAAGAKKVWSVGRVPSAEEEDRRPLHRERLTAKRDRTRVLNRIKGLLAAQGLTLALHGDVPPQLALLRWWDGSPVPPGLRQRLTRDWEQVEGLAHRIVPLEAERRELLRTPQEAAIRQVRQLLTLKGIGENSAWLFVMEFFGWRALRNGQEVGAWAGLTPTPHASGTTAYELGLPKAGHRYLRALAVESAWGWLRFQPASARSQWDQARFGQGRSRVRRIGIVALARKLLVALGRFLERGVVPTGAILKAEDAVR